MRQLLAAILFALAALTPALASPGPEERMQDPALEARARDLYRELRCVVCQSQSIDESNAPLAADMRAVVRDRLRAGDSDAEVRAWLQERYGDYVLMMPPVQASTLGLWLLPVLVLVGGGIGITVFIRSQRRRGNDAELAAEDEARARALMDEESLS
jgi:cytochrome c-type biogenesis protein CcmH